MSGFDPAKEAKNLEKHHISLERWVDLTVVALVRDDRFDYGEPRFRAYGLIDGQPCCLVFTLRNGTKRPISLRRAHSKELKRYAS
ncbi:MAG: BrnT family toxin [Tardiphaga sp.]